MGFPISFHGYFQGMIRLLNKLPNMEYQVQLPILWKTLSLTFNILGIVPPELNTDLIFETPCHYANASYDGYS